MEIVVKDFIMPELYLSGVEAKPEDRDSGGSDRFWLLCDSVAHFGSQVAPPSSHSLLSSSRQGRQRCVCP